MRNWILVFGAFALLLMAGCILPGGNETSPTPIQTPSPNATHTPAVSPTAHTPTPHPSVTPHANQTPAGCPTTCRYGCVPGTTTCAEPGCPPSCLYGCEVNTTVCKQPVCPPSCLYGCITGTTTCKTVIANVSMVNPDFETGTYAGWNVTGSGWGSAPTSGSLANSQHLYYSVPYSGWQGTYFASSYQTGGRGAVGSLQSAPFTLDKKYLEFLAIGQDDAQLCVALKIEDETTYLDCNALRASPNVIRLFQPTLSTVSPYSIFKRVSWDVSAYKGKQATIQVIDNSVRSWIEVDDFRQADTSSVTPVTAGNVSGYNCNGNGLCEPGLGEYEYGCQSDCPSPSSCRYTQWLAGPVDYTVYCHSFRLMPSGLFLYLKNTGIGVNHSITLRGVRCTKEATPDPSTYAPFDKALAVGEIYQISNGTMPCYEENGSAAQLAVGNLFSGKIYVAYEDASTHYMYYDRLNFDAPVLATLAMGTVGQPAAEPAVCVFPPGLSCDSFALHINGSLDLTLGQSRGGPIRVEEIACVPQSAPEPAASAYTLVGGVVIPNGDERAVSGHNAHATVNCGSGGRLNETAKWKIWVKYNETATSVRRQSVGDMTAEYVP